jgi:glutamine synthetase
MDNVRARGDALEKLVDKKAWPFPGYMELLFKL